MKKRSTRSLTRNNPRTFLFSISFLFLGNVTLLCIHECKLLSFLVSSYLFLFFCPIGEQRFGILGWYRRRLLRSTRAWLRTFFFCVYFTLIVDRRIHSQLNCLFSFSMFNVDFFLGHFIFYKIIFYNSLFNFV